MLLKELGDARSLVLPENLLSSSLTKCEPTMPFTAVLLANKSLLSSPMVAPETDALAPLLLLAITELATFRIAPLAETRAPLPLANRCAWFTVPTPPPATSIALLVREMFTRSAEKDAPPAVDATLMPSPPILLILVSLTSTEAAALNATSMPCVVKP